MNFYSVYGLRVAANRPLPGVIECSRVRRPDVRLQLGALPAWIGQRSEEHYEGGAGEQPGNAYRPHERIRLLRRGAFLQVRYLDGTTFLMNRRATAIWAWWPDSSTLEDTVCYLLGPILGYALRLRRRTILHASVINVSGRAVCFVGPSGAGKSTMAAAFAVRGYPVLADDQAVLAERDGVFLVQPGYPRIRLWPSSVDLLFGAKDFLPPLSPTWNKRFLGLDTPDRPFEHRPLPLSVVYLLADRAAGPDAARITPEAPASGLLKLIANTYVGHRLDPELRALDFERLARLARLVPLRTAVVPADPTFLPGLCDWITADLHLNRHEEPLESFA